MLKQVINDTLKIEGKYSRTSLTMFSAWVLVYLISIIDYVRTGYRSEVWLTLVAVAVGVKLSDAIGKRINK
jgi:hypothetical protein